MCMFDKALYNENKSLRKEIKELKATMDESDNVILLEVLDAFVESKNMYEDFKKFAKSYVLKYKTSNKLLEIIKRL